MAPATHNLDATEGETSGVRERSEAETTAAQITSETKYRSTTEDFFNVQASDCRSTANAWRDAIAGGGGRELQY